MLAAIIQARMGSTRLPGKTLADIGEKPMLERVIERIKASSAVEEIIVATTVEPGDGVLEEFAAARGFKCFRGSEQDVLDRFYQTASRFAVRHIVRVTPDCPLLDPRVMDQVIGLYRTGQYDYVSNVHGRRFPDGLDVEVFSFEALAQAWREAKRPSEREHVTEYIEKHPDRFRIGNVQAERDCSGCKWSVDDEHDLAFVRSVYHRLGRNGHLFYFEDVMQLLQESPELLQANSANVVNEGWYRSLAAEPPVPPLPRTLHVSDALKRRAEPLIPGGAQTFSKGPTQFVQGVAPAYLARGQGCRIWDVDGNEYLDCGMALGPVILGYHDPDVDEAVRRQLRDGVGFPLPHPLEVELAELLHELIPCAEMVRFGKNGSDATSGAVRLARAYTGREVIACCGYHGWQDWYIGTTTRNKGVPKAVQALTRTFEYNNLESLERIFAEHRGQVAAVIMEPVGVVEPRDGFLEAVQAAARREGALLIFDEVITGFRLRLGGAQEYFGVTPDLACFGKAMANGFPLSAVVGRREVMQLMEEIFFSFTFGGETLSLAAALATIRKMRREQTINHLWAQGQVLRDGYRVLARHFGLETLTDCQGLAPRTVITFNAQPGLDPLVIKSLFQQECLKRGVLFTGAQNVSASHGEAEVEQILRVYRTVLEIVSGAVKAGDVAARLEGPAVQPVFRKA